MKKHFTIKDIARELGISTSTVSRALNDKYDVSPSTRKAVLDLASEMNFRPNPYAANLVNKKTGMIGVVVPEFINSFYPRIIIAIQNVLAQEGYNVLITQSNENPELELRNLNALEYNRVEGILASTCRGDVNEWKYKELIENGIPVVFFSRDCPGVSAPRVGIDDYKLAYQAVNSLINNGKKKVSKILHLGGPEYLSSSAKRWEGWRDAMVDCGRELWQDSVLRCDGITMADGYKAMSYWLQNCDGILPEAIFAFNDPLAIGAMKAIKEYGANIPEDVKIMGFSESLEALVVEPNLSSVAQPLEEMGEVAARLLLKKLHNPASPDKRIVLDGKINIRESSKS